MTHTTEELERLMREATPGPWFTFANGHCVGGTPTDGSASGVAMCSMAARTPEEVQANAALIVAAVNSLSPLIARVEELEGALGALVDRDAELNPMRTADFHKAHCNCNRCLFDTARAALKGGA